MSPPSIQLLRALKRASRAYSTNYCHGAFTKPLASLPVPIRHKLALPPQPHRASSPTKRLYSAAPKSKDRGPLSQEDTQTDFGTLNVLGNSAPPSTNIDACLSDGFHFDNGVKIGDGSGCLLVSGEVFAWRPWETGGGMGRQGMLNTKGQWDVNWEAWGLLDLVWPKPELLILGLGASIYPVSPETRASLSSLGIRVDVLDTRNAAAQFNLLATERGVGNVAAALIPIGWKGR